MFPDSHTVSGEPSSAWRRVVIYETLHVGNYLFIVEELPPPREHVRKERHAASDTVQSLAKWILLLTIPRHRQLFAAFTRVSGRPRLVVNREVVTRCTISVVDHFPPAITD